MLGWCCQGIWMNSDSTCFNWTASSEFGTYRLCEQRRFRRACASAQSRQNLRCSLLQAVSQEEPSDKKPDPWPLWMAGHAQLKFVMTECSKTQIRLTGLQLMFPSKFILLLLQIKRCIHLSWFVCSDKILFIDWWKECSYLGFTARQDYFTHFEPSQSYGGAITGDTREKPPDHPQEELGLSHMWPEVSSNPHRWDDERVRAFFLWHLLFVTNKSTNDQYRNHCSWQVS